MFVLWKKVAWLVLSFTMFGTYVSAEECNLKNCTLIEQNISCIASDSKICKSTEMVCSIDDRSLKTFEKLSTYSWVGLAVRPVLKKALVMLGWAGEPTVRDQIDRNVFLKIMAFLASDEVSFIATALSAFSFASFSEAPYIASVPPVAILSYRILTDVYKVGHALVDGIFNWFIGKDEYGAQRPGYHWKTRLFGWIGFGAYTKDRKYDEDVEYLRKLDNCWIGDTATFWGKFKKIFFGAPTRDIIREEKRATFEKMLEMKSLDDLYATGNTLNTLIGEGLSLTMLLQKGASVRDILDASTSCLPMLYNDGTQAEELIDALSFINGGQISRDYVESIVSNYFRNQDIVDDFLRKFDERSFMDTTGSN